MKTVLFVPGGGEDSQSRNYAAVLKAIESKGYKTNFVPITWLRTTIDKWAPEFMMTYLKYQPADTILAGFSWGAMTAFVAATQRPPAELWLFSLSPYFAEDLPHLKKSWLRQIGHRRVSAFQGVSFSELSPKIVCPVKIFAGGKEPATLLRRCQDAANKLPNANLVMVDGVSHDIADPNYIAAITENI